MLEFTTLVTQTWLCEHQNHLLYKWRLCAGTGHCSITHPGHKLHRTPGKPVPLLWEAGWDSQELTSVNGRASMCRKTVQSLHNSHREGTSRKSNLFVSSQYFKEESDGAFFRNSDHCNCCWCKQKLQMLWLSEGSDPSAKCNEYYGLFPFSVLPGLFCIPEQYCRAIAIRSDLLLPSDLGCVIYQTIHTFDPLLRALEITPANTVRSTCPASSSGAQPHSFPPLWHMQRRWQLSDVWGI